MATEVDQLKEALAQTHRMALAYRGPREREFVELAKRAYRHPEPSARQRDGTVDDQQVEELDPKHQLEEVISYLFALAFPATKDTADEIYQELSSLLEQPITGVRIVGLERSFQLRSQLPARIPRRHRHLYSYFREMLPMEDSLDD